MARAQQSTPSPTTGGPEDAQHAHPNRRSRGGAARCSSGRFLVAIPAAVVGFACGPQSGTGRHDAGDPPHDPHRPPRARAHSARTPPRVADACRWRPDEPCSVHSHRGKRLPRSRLRRRGRRRRWWRRDDSHEPFARNHGLDVLGLGPDGRACDHTHEPIARVHALRSGACEPAGDHAHELACVERCLRHEARRDPLERRGSR